MNYDTLITAITEAHGQALDGAAGAVNRHLILRNWLIGAHLVEFEQKGEDRAKYGTGLLKRAGGDLRKRGIPGTSPDMLERMRRLYLLYPQLTGQISAPAVRNLALPDTPMAPAAISAPAVRKSKRTEPRPLPTSKLLELSWTHLAELVRLDDRAVWEQHHGAHEKPIA